MVTEDQKKKTVADVLATESGKELFRFLFEICGYEQTSIVLDVKTGTLDLDKSLYNEARRAVYIQLRTLALVSSSEALKDVEYREQKIAVTEEKK